MSSSVLAKVTWPVSLKADLGRLTQRILSPSGLCWDSSRGDSGGHSRWGDGEVSVGALLLGFCCGPYSKASLPYGLNVDSHSSHRNYMSKAVEPCPSRVSEELCKI